MTQTTRFLALTSLALVSITPAEATSPISDVDQGSLLTILVWDMADSDPRLVAGAIETAREILTDAGVAASWVVCSGMAKEERPTACGAQPGPWVLRLRLMSEAGARLLPVAANNFGIALPGKKGELGSLAYVFVERTRRHAETIGVSDTLLLGHMAAHELGHLLLGGNSHAVNGIMTARFKAKHLQAAGQGGIGFFKGQAKSMRAQVERRLGLRPVGADRSGA